MIKRVYRVYGFSTTHKVLAAEALLVEYDIPVRTVPRPEQLGNAECGVALRVALHDAELVDKLFFENQIIPATSAHMDDVSI